MFRKEMDSTQNPSIIDASSANLRISAPMISLLCADLALGLALGALAALLSPVLALPFLDWPKR